MHSWHHHPQLHLSMESVHPLYTFVRLAEVKGSHQHPKEGTEAGKPSRQGRAEKKLERKQGPEGREEEKERGLRGKKPLNFPISHMVTTHLDLETLSGASAKKRLLAPRVQEKVHQP